MDEFFKYYDKVFSFDLSDCNKYNLNFLPLYWIPNLRKNLTKYDIFGFASYSPLKPERTNLYKKIKYIADINNLKSFIKLYVDIGNDNRITFFAKSIVKCLLGIKSISPSLLLRDITTFDRLSPDEYRNYINSSDTILDTHNNIKKYKFYSPDQFYILSEVDAGDERLLKFLTSQFVITDEYYDKIREYRIDNWIKTILGN